MGPGATIPEDLPRRIARFRRGVVLDLATEAAWRGAILAWWAVIGLAALAFVPGSLIFGWLAFLLTPVSLLCLGGYGMVTRQHLPEWRARLRALRVMVPPELPILRCGETVTIPLAAEQGWRLARVEETTWVRTTRRRGTTYRTTVWAKVPVPIANGRGDAVVTIPAEGPGTLRVRGRRLGWELRVWDVADPEAWRAVPLLVLPVRLSERADSPPARAASP